jgi:photosystem II stability/assembly factor-like uncharacterized protein
MVKAFNLLCWAVLLVALSCGAFAQNVPELLYYKFNETGGTATQNFANPGVGTNPAPVTGLTMGGTGQFGAALNGTGVASNFVNTGWNTALGTGSWTVSMWLNNLPSNTTLYYLWGDNTAGSFRSFLGGAAGAGATTLRVTGLADCIVTGVAPGPTVVTYVYDQPANQVRAYKNGVLATTATPTAALNINGTAPFRVGAYSTSIGLPAAGLMDEFRMYNRALSATEIAATWNQSLPLGTPGWTAQTSGITTALYSVKAVNSQIVWTAGAGGKVLLTTNGGTAWTNVGGGNIGTMDLYNVAATSATTAFVTGTPSTTSYIFRTTNGGTSWDTVYTQAGGFINAIHMFDATNGIAQGDPVGGKWTIVRTTNGGTSWARIATEPTQVGTEAGSNNGLAAVGTTHIWFTSNSSPPKVYKTTDGGATWNSGTLPGTATFTAGLAFLGTQYGIAGGNNGNAARTTDGGATWSSVTVGTSGAIYGMAGAGTIDFWATRGTTIQTSSNLGANWRQDFSDATAGTFEHVSFVTTGNIANGWAVTSSGKIYTYFNPVNAHDLGVTSISRLTAASRPASNPPPATDASAQAQEVDGYTGPAIVSDEAPDAPSSGLIIEPLKHTSFDLADTVRFRAIVKNFGTLPESTYQVAWAVNGVGQTPVSNTRPIASGANDTLAFQWNLAVNGVHTVRAWTVLATESNRANDTASLTFNVGLVPGDTLYTFIVPNQIILGVNRMGPSNKMVFTSGGQSSAVTTDNKWIVTTLNGAILDTTHPQVNNTTGQGFGFRDLAWDGTWLLTSDDVRLRRIDTTTFTEIATPITGPGTLQRGVAWEMTNRIWKANFTTDPIVKFDTTGATIKSIGVPTVAPYGLAFDKWTSPNRGYLWYAQPSTTGGPSRLSKVDTATGAILQTFDYGTTFGISGGLDIFVGHPAYPGRVIAALGTQNFPNSRCMIINLGPDSSVTGPPPTEARADHNTTAMRVTVTNEGNVGSLNAFVGTGPGNGFMFNPVSSAGQRLFEGAIMLGLDTLRVSDAARNNASPEVFDADFKYLSNLDSSASAGIRKVITTSYTDSLAENPFRVRVNQRTVSYDTAGLNSTLFMELDLTNTSATAWTSLLAGGFFDWDVNPANAQDRGSVIVDSTNTIPGVNSGNPFPFDMMELHQSASPNTWIGVVPLHQNRFKGRRIAISSTEVYPPHMSNTDKYNYMSANRATNPNGDGGSGVDHAQVFGFGPYTVAASGTKRIGFALVAGTSLQNFIDNARAAQRAWVQRLGNTFTIITGVDNDPSAGIPETFALDQNYPNPFNPTTTLRYALPEAARVNLSIFNVLGQRVATLASEVQSAGYYNATWSGRNDAGVQVASGVYFYRIEAAPTSGTAPFVSLKKMVLIK